MGTERRPVGPDGAVYTNDEAILSLLLDLKAAFDLVDAKIRRFEIPDDETEILSRTLQLRRDLAWEIDQRDPTGPISAGRPRLRLVRPDLDRR